MHPFGTAGIDKLAHHVAFAVFPGAVLDAMFGVLAGPEAEAVVVLGREDHPRDAGRLGRTHPLASIEFCRIEQLGVLGSVAPFPVGKRVHAEMDEC